MHDYFNNNPIKKFMLRKKLALFLCLIATGTWLCQLHAAAGHTKKQTRDAYVVWEPQLVDATQFSSNSFSTTNGSSFANLIDGDPNTVFHSVWDTEMASASTTVESWVERLGEIFDGVNSDPGYHNLQVELFEPISTFRFEYKSRNSAWHDNPNHIDIYATNDPTLGASTSNSDQDQWTHITELTPENTDFPGDEVVIDEPWQSPVIKMREPFQYIRFVVKNTSIANNPSGNPTVGDTRTFAVPEITGVTFNMGEFQLYAPREVTDPKEILSNLVDSVRNIWNTNTFETGTDPGYVNAEKYASTYSLWEEADAATFDNLSSEQYNDYITRLRAAITDFMENGTYKVETGYYNIINAHPDFYSLQGVTKSMCVNAEKQLAWTNTDSLSATQLWYIEKLDNGNFSIKNVASGEYIGTVEGNLQNVPMFPNHMVDQVFRRISSNPGQFNISNVQIIGQTELYHAKDHENGAGLSGRIATWNNIGSEASMWYVHHVTDQELIDKLVNQGPQAILAQAMSLALDSANNSRNKANEYKKLINRVDQIASNAQSPGNGSAYANLIDGNTSTIFHSVWESNFASATQLGTSYGWHNLQFTLDEPVSAIRFDFTGRVNTSGWTDIPNHITIYGTNDDALGASTAAADSAQWTMIEDMTNDKYSFPKNSSGAVYHSPAIDFNGNSYKYLRFVVKHTTTMEPGNSRENAFMSPQATGVTFNLSEFQMYDPVPTEKSQYFTVPGMKEACDALDAAITAAQEKLAAGTLTEADITTLQTAYRLVDTLYVDRPTIFGQLTSLLESGKNLTDLATGSRVALIKNVSQLNTNSDNGTSSQLSNLIDGNTGTYFHSVWNTGMANPDITETMWNDTIIEHFPLSTGTGYHNLNVALAEPVSSFNFEFYSRNNANWHDNPSDLEIYATNDPELFAEVRASSTSNWTLITEITEGLPTDAAVEVPYTSPSIELNGEYKYIRFVVKNTCTANNPTGNTTIGHTRDFLNPDVTGVTWNCSEFQMYSGLAPESIQYNYIPEVKEAVDEIRVLFDKYGSYTESDINSKAPVAELTAALKKLQEAYVDTTDVVELYNNYKEIAGRTTEGDAVGDVQSYDAITAFEAAIDEARRSIDAKSPTKEQINAATEKMNNSYDEFMSYVILPEPYEWYVIRSGVTDENFSFAIDQPIFLGDVSTGAQLWLGRYPVDGSGSEFSDVYAIWRLVPVESNEPVAEGEEVKPWKRTFAVQSLGTGQYWGPYRGQGASNCPLMSNEQTPYRLFYYGMGCFKLQQDGVEDPMDCLKADASNQIVLNYPANSGHQQAWKFEKVEDQSYLVNINWFPANTTSIITLPWDLTGENVLYNLNDGIETYAVNSVIKSEGAESDEPSYTLTLTAKDEFEAGEPFVIVTTGEPNEDGQQPLTFYLPPAEAGAITDTSSVVRNGLVGTLEGVDIKGQTSLYFENSVLNVCTDKGVFIAVRGGYIDVTKVQDLGGTIDKTISINGVINNIANVEVIENGNAPVDVYTTDGVLIRRNVARANATDGLVKGIYIVGKKKVLVK